MTEPFPPRLVVSSDTFLALVQMQIDYYAVQGKTGPDYVQRAESDIACAFCVLPTPIRTIIDNWNTADKAKAQREYQADKDDEQDGDWTR